MLKFQDNEPTNQKQMTHIRGGCHCGAIKFSAQVDPDSTLLNCNCSICRMTGFQHLIVRHQDFTLHSGQDQLVHYQFNTRQADHLFCSICGIKSFYQPRSHPDCWSINVNCLEDFELSDWAIEDFDGQNWQQANQKLHEQ